MFIERHGLWSDEQRAQAAELAKRLAAEKLDLVRLVWADPHGAARAKALSVPVFLEALASGYNINVATTTLDSAGGRVFRSFTAGGGMGLAEMTGSPNLVVVPDPGTFRVLPWAREVGWVLCDEYFRDGRPFHFSPRHVLRRQLARTRAELRVGLEVEWYLARVAEPALGDEHVGVPGVRGRPVRTTPVEPGYSYHSETNMDLMQPVLGELARAYAALGLPLRSLENEWGPGQVECTFGAQGALRAADDLVLFRTATRQVCRRLGYFATFMARPALKGYYASGWHLHQSLAEGGRNLFTPERGPEPLSPTGRAFLGGLLHHAVAATVFATPTVNGYRRYKPNSLAPDRAGWGFDHRGAMVRVLGGAGDPATRLENRAGEPAANPYLYIASQLAAGLDGLEHQLDPGPRDDEPYAAERPRLPASLAEALDALEASALFRTQFGELFIDYYLRLKRNELGRYLEWKSQQGATGDDPTAWEQNEYFDFF
ncbi:MAG TPA: glutamine synthetase family protein [Burkholderiales bacterium]|nr:glutamine synthetase family protein [Burkholderiales bacterium]